MQRVYLNKELLNKVLKREENPRRRVGKIKVNRRLLEEQLQKNEGDFFLSLFVATDAQTGKFRYSPSGDMVFNAKPQKLREDQDGGIVDPIQDDDHSQTWAE